MQPGFASNDQRLAYALLRIAVGINLLMHGLSRIIAGISQFAAKLVLQFAHVPLPASIVWIFAFALPAIETAIGLLILLGLRTRSALIAATLLIVVLTLGSTLIQDWTAAAIQLTYAVVYTALLFLRRYNGWALDAWIEPLSSGVPPSAGRHA